MVEELPPLIWTGPILSSKGLQEVITRLRRSLDSTTRDTTSLRLPAPPKVTVVPLQVPLKDMVAHHHRGNGVLVLGLYLLKAMAVLDTGHLPLSILRTDSNRLQVRRDHPPGTNILVSSDTEVDTK